MPPPPPPPPNVIISSCNLSFNPGSELESFLQSLNQRNIELNHRQIAYEGNHTTLAWKIIPNNCSISQIQSYAPCQQNNAHFNITINETKITLPLESFNDQLSGELIDFSISSISDQSSDDCPQLLDTVRFNGKSNPHAVVPHNGIVIIIIIMLQLSAT